MPQLSDFISRIFSTDRTQGLSGGAEVVIDQDPASAFYAARLRKHRADEDLVGNPEFLWSTPSFQGRKGGLRAHVHAERGDGVASFTDALIVVNQADWERARLSTLDGPWLDRATGVLTERFAQYCARDRFELLYGTRPLRFRFLADGGAEMLGQSFNLGPGEYITGLLPNTYVGPAARSRAVLAVHLNLPGVWEGYREVGRLYSDQILFTLGRHWLDNFHHPALREPGLYRLQQYPDGSLVHVISPELQDRYLVRSDAVEGGASVLTVAEWNGTAVAYLVLAVVESMTMDFSSRPDIDLPAAPAPVASPVQAVVDEIPTGDGAPAAPEPSAPLAIGLAGGSAAAGGPEPQARPPSSVPSGFQNRAMLSKTIVPGAIESRILTLHERGALLQKVHFSNFMDGYDVYIGAGGRVGTQVSEPKATLQVRGGRVSLKVDDASVRVDDKAVPIGKSVPLRGQVTIEVDGNRLTYKDLTDVRAEGWPYLGELRRPGAGSYLEFGQAHRVGRDRRCKVRLPDEPHNENIAWLPSVGGGTTIRSRTGDIPKSRFYTDSIMVASEHAEFDLRGEPVLRSLARHCHTFVRRGPEVVSLFPREGAGGRQDFELQANDEVLVGNCLFQVAFPPLGGASSQPSSAPEIPRLTPADLAAQVDEAPGGLSRATVEPPPAAGFGERGAPPRAVKLDPPSSKAPRAAEPAAKPPPEPAAPPVAPPAGDKPPPPMMLGTMSFYMDPPQVLSETTNEDPPTPTEPAVPAPSVETTYDPSEPVLSVDEATWKFEISRPAQLVVAGWMVSGEVTVGNHRTCAVVIPEVRAFKEQAFMTLEYFRLFVRGKRGKVELLQAGEASVRVAGASVESTDDLDQAALAVVRRDANLEPDFDVLLSIRPDPSLPDPRARLLALDTSDRLVAALFTTGCPLRSARSVQLGPITASVVYDGQRLHVSEYLESYRQPTGFRPFFLREAGRPWRTVPEDGTPFSLAPGDSLMAGVTVYGFQVA